MVELKEAETIKREESDLNIDPRGNYLSGDLKLLNGSYFFYRNNTRYIETVAGYFGKKYGFGMDSAILQHMWKYDEIYEAIYIETEFNIWRIRYGDFLDYCISTPIQYYHVCSEEHFSQIKKHDPTIPANKRNYNNDPSIKREADNVNKQAKKNGTKEKTTKKGKGKSKKKTTGGKETSEKKEASMDNEPDSKVKGKSEKENSKEDTRKKASSEEKEEDKKPGAQQSLF